MVSLRITIKEWQNTLKWEIRNTEVKISQKEIVIKETKRKSLKKFGKELNVTKTTITNFEMDNKYKKIYQTIMSHKE